MKIVSAESFKNLAKLKSKRSFWLALALALLLTAGLVYWYKIQNNHQANEVQYLQTQVQRGDILIGLDSDGTIDFSKVTLRFDVRGTIAEILVAEGEQVRKGDIIARLDDRDYQDQYQLALARLQEAREQEITSLLDDELTLQKAEADLEKLRDEVKEMETIPEAYAANEIKQKKYELTNKETELRNLRQKYELKKARGLDQIELEVKMAKEDLEDTILYAPVDGVVLHLAKKVGESLMDEDDFATIHEDNTVKAITKVIEYDIGQIKVGQRVYVTVEALPDKKFSGQVTKVNALPSADSSGLVNYDVEITIKDPGEDLKDGMTCAVSFVLKEVKNCLIVPYQAVKMVQGKQVVTVLNEQGQEETRQIKTGFTDGTNVEVLEGLKGNETVVYRKASTTNNATTSRTTNNNQMFFRSR